MSEKACLVLLRLTGELVCRCTAVTLLTEVGGVNWESAIKNLLLAKPWDGAPSSTVDTSHHPCVLDSASLVTAWPIGISATLVPSLGLVLRNNPNGASSLTLNLDCAIWFRSP